MDSVGIRELQQHASEVVRRARRGETVGITDRGTLVAVLGPATTATGAAALVASGRVRASRSTISSLAPAQPATRSTADVLDELRTDR